MNETGIWTGILNKKKLGTFKFIYVRIIENYNHQNHQKLKESIIIDYIQNQKLTTNERISTINNNKRKFKRRDIYNSLPVLLLFILSNSSNATNSQVSLKYMNIIIIIRL